MLTADIRALSAEELLRLGRDLFAKGHDEAGFERPLSVDDSLFLALDKCGVLTALGLFAGEELVGYVVATTTRSAFDNELVCSVMSIFVLPEHRHQGQSERLMDELKAVAQEEGAGPIRWHVPVNSVVHPVFVRRGARLIEHIYEER